MEKNISSIATWERLKYCNQTYICLYKAVIFTLLLYYSSEGYGWWLVMVTATEMVYLGFWRCKALRHRQAHGLFHRVSWLYKKMLYILLYVTPPTAHLRYYLHKSYSIENVCRICNDSSVGTYTITKRINVLNRTSFMKFSFFGLMFTMARCSRAS